MTFAQIQSGQPIELTGGTITSGDVQFSYETMQLWSDDERKACDVYAVTDDDIPEGKIATASSLEMVDNEVRRHYDLTDAPAPSPPTVVTAAQAKLAIFNAGIFDSVEAAISNSYRGIQIYWSAATQFERYHPYILGIAAELEMTDEQMDGLFTQAAAIV